MICVSFLKRRGGIAGFLASGHADGGEYGQDLVCAAVSAIVQTTVLGLCNVLTLKADVEFNEEGESHCLLDEGVSEGEFQKTQLLFETMREGLLSVETAYPGTIRIFYKEV